MIRFDPATKRNLVGPKLKEIRLRCKPPVTQEDLIARLERKGIKIDRSALVRIEQGKRMLTDYELVFIAKCLRIPPSQLLTEFD